MPDTATETAQATTEAAKGAEPVTDGKPPDAGKTETQEAAAQKTDEAQAKAEVKPTVPEKYDLKLPDGSLLPPSTIEKISAYAKEKGLSNEAAQELLDREHQAVTEHHEAQMKQVEEIRTSWLKAAETDTEIGGKDFKQNAELAKRVVERFGSDEFKKALNETGFGNHPEVVRTFVRIGRLMSEDQFVMPKSQPAGQDPEDIAAKMYPSMAKKN